MRRLTCSLTVSLDGYIVGPDGGFEWAAPDEEVFRFATDEVRQLGVHLLGRRLYETMLYWETADQDPSLSDPEREFAALWRSLPKVVFSEPRWLPTRLRWGSSTSTGCESNPCWSAAVPRSSRMPSAARTLSSSTAARSARGSCTWPTA